MNESELKALLARIEPRNESAYAAAVARMDSFAKPPGSLGALETIAARLAGVTGETVNALDKRCVLVFSADNGVVAEGIASGPQSITTAQTINMLRGLTGVAVLAQCYGSELRVHDVGVNANLPDVPGLRRHKIRMGTGNIAAGPAMTREEALTAIGVGVEAARQAGRDGIKVLGVGEMGIGNTTTSSAVLCGLLGLRGDAVGETVGRGAGLVDAAFAKKIEVIRRALEGNDPDRNDPVDVLAKVGGFDLAAMCGAFLGAALERIPVVIDGFISVVAALCAARLAPDATACFFASHASHERGYRLALDQLGLEAYLALDMRLGEGSGCPLMFSVMDGACHVMAHMATFAEAEINTDYLAEITKEHSF